MNKPLFIMFKLWLKRLNPIYLFRATQKEKYSGRDTSKASGRKKEQRALKRIHGLLLFYSDVLRRVIPHNLPSSLHLFLWHRLHLPTIEPPPYFWFSPTVERVEPPLDVPCSLRGSQLVIPLRKVLNRQGRTQPSTRQGR